jgi:predicted acetyltransferase
MQDLPIVQNLSRLYIYDMSEFLGWACPDTGLFGGCDEFFADWQAGANHPHLIMRGNELAGFAGAKAEGEGHCIQEFFVLRKFRRKGVGRQMAGALFDSYPGAWTVKQLARNAPAIAFWKAVIHDYTSGQFSENDEQSPWGAMHAIRFSNAT